MRLGGLLILDEPTASAPANEVEQLLETLRSFADRGQSILYVTHRLDEVHQLADSVTVLRDGVVRGKRATAGLSEEDLVELIVGRKVDQVFQTMPKPPAGDPILTLADVTAGPLQRSRLHYQAGEVVGLGGLLDSGRTELLEAICGALPVQSGTVTFEGRGSHCANRDRGSRGDGLRARGPCAGCSLRRHVRFGQHLDRSINDYFRTGIIRSGA